ncbi:MAG: hypothetical protein ABSH48_21405 [Verrucomicrobiota bacterium]
MISKIDNVGTADEAVVYIANVAGHGLLCVNPLHPPDPGFQPRFAREGAPGSLVAFICTG